MAFIPLLIVCSRICIVQDPNDHQLLVAGPTEDKTNYVLSYLVAMFLPFYQGDPMSYRDLLATGTALSLIVFIFYRLELHYLNVGLAFFKYQAFSVAPPSDGNQYTRQDSFILITKRKVLKPGETYMVWRVTDTVYLEKPS